jgi:hypothetical protein
MCSRSQSPSASIGVLRTRRSVPWFWKNGSNHRANSCIAPTLIFSDGSIDSITYRLTIDERIETDLSEGLTIPQVAGAPPVVKSSDKMPTLDQVLSMAVGALIKPFCHGRNERRD